MENLVVGALITAFFVWLNNWHSEKRILKRNALYLAVRVYCILERYVLECSDVVIDYGEPDASGGYHCLVKAPAHPIYPQELDWRSIPCGLMLDLLSLPNDADYADKVIAAVSDLSDPPEYMEYFEERQSQYAQLGLKTLSLMDQLSKKYRISKKSFADGWDPRALFNSKLKEIEEIQSKRILLVQQFEASDLGVK